jgi:hypothetical protein
MNLGGWIRSREGRPLKSGSGFRECSAFSRRGLPLLPLLPVAFLSGARSIEGCLTSSSVCLFISLPFFFLETLSNSNHSGETRMWATHVGVMSAPLFFRPSQIRFSTFGDLKIYTHFFLICDYLLYLAPNSINPNIGI